MVFIICISWLLCQNMIERTHPSTSSPPQWCPSRPVRGALRQLWAARALLSFQPHGPHFQCPTLPQALHSRVTEVPTIGCAAGALGRSTRRKEFSVECTPWEPPKGRATDCGMMGGFFICREAPFLQSRYIYMYRSMSKESLPSQLSITPFAVC